MEDRCYAYWLANISGVGCRTIHQLRKYCGSARELYGMGAKALLGIYGIGEGTAARICESKKQWDLEGAWEMLGSKGISFVSMEEDGYPKRLREIYDPPYALYFIGGLPREEIKTVGIVGARTCSAYGRDVALAAGKCLASCGAQVISGMARGIDGYGHRGALSGGGKTYGVLGCGIDVVYPPEHAALYKSLTANGGVISEYPPGMQPLPGFFPARNRIIAALSDALLLVEARERSGSLITADLALEQGKDIYAVPGRISDPLSVGCNRLIRQGAGIFLSPRELARELGLFSEKNKLPLEKSEHLVYSCLGLHPKSIEELGRETAMDFVTLTQLLLEMQQKGLVEEVWRNHYISVS